MLTRVSTPWDEEPLLQLYWATTNLHDVIVSKIVDLFIKGTPILTLCDGLTHGMPTDGNDCLAHAHLNHI